MEKPSLEGDNSLSGAKYLEKFPSEGGNVADCNSHPARSRAETYPATNHPALAPEIAHAQSPKSSAIPSGERKRRSTSPAGRLKVALSSRRSTLDLDSKTNNQDVATYKEKVANPNNRGSVASRIGLIFYDKGELPPVPPLPVFDSSKQYPVDLQTPSRTSNLRESTHLALSATPFSSKSSQYLNSHDASSYLSGAGVTGPNVVTPASAVMISSGRIRSGSATLIPTKLSNITSAPLTPTPENSITPQNPEGFFSTVLNVAQSAASTLSNSIGNNVGSANIRNSRSLPDLEEVLTAESEDTAEQSHPAVKTLGAGDLSLEQLGISENSNNGSSVNILINNNPSETSKRNMESIHDLQTTSLGRSSTLSSSMISEQSASKIRSDVPPLDRPRTMCEPMSVGDQTPPNVGLTEAITWSQRSSGTQRSNSNRSGHRRKRASSANTNCTTIGAAIVAANSSIVQQPRLAAKVTGFAVASKKRNKDFHQLFRSVPDDDYLIEDYSCALQREILAHGRLYVSEGHLCFSSNIFGWVTTLVMSFDEIVSVEKRSTALVFKNGLMITTLHAKNVFASFTSRDSTYDLIVGIWKLGYPSLRSSLNGIHLAETGGGDKTEKYDSNNANGSQSDSDLDIDGDDDDDDDDIYDEADEDEGEDGMSFTNVEESLVGSDFSQKILTSKASNINTINNFPSEKFKETEASTFPSIDFPGPLSHAPTECSEQDGPFSKIVADELIQSPIGRVWNFIFGTGSQVWFRNFLTVDQKCFDYIQEENAYKPLAIDNKVRNYSYIKPLGGPIGPKQTKCICIETLDFFDLEKYISVTISTQTPDVPSGNIFCIKTRYCFMWGPNNCTRLQISYMIEWTGKSWLKGPIEKGAADGQSQYARDIITALKNTLSSSRGITVTASKGKKSRRKGKEGQLLSRVPDRTSNPKSRLKDWMISLEFLEPFLGILRPLLTGNIMYGLLVGLLVASWFRFGLVKNGSDVPEAHWHGSPERLAAYEEIWRKEESELWKWLEDRVGMELLRDINSMPIERRRMDRKLQEETLMQEREIEDAIKVTEERLQVLKKSYEEARAKKTNKNNENDPFE